MNENNVSMTEGTYLSSYFCQKQNALAGSRTRIYCLESNNANRYTTNAYLIAVAIVVLSLKKHTNYSLLPPSLPYVHVGSTDVSHSTQACSTQTSSTSKISNPQPTSVLRKEGVNFSKYSGGVSYLERLMVRRHRCDPHFLVATRDPNKCPLKGIAGVPDANEIHCEESGSGRERVPSKYNLFQSTCADGVEDVEWYTNSRSLSFPVCLEPDETALPRPTSSVQIEEVKVVDCCHESLSLKQHIGDSKNGKKSAVLKIRQGKPRQKDREKRCPARKKKQTREKRNKKHEIPNTSEKSVSNSAQVCSITEPTAFGQTYMESVRHVWQTDTKMAMNASGKLSEFFLFGVEADDNTEETRETQAQTGGMISKPILPISATTWLPGNSVLSEDEKSCTTRGDPHSLASGTSTTTSLSRTNDHKPNPLFCQPESIASSFNPPPHCASPAPDPLPHSSSNPLLRTSIYCIETDLPPPNRGRNSPSQQISCSLSLSAQLSSCSISPVEQLSGRHAGRGAGIEDSILLDGESDTDEDKTEYLDRLGNFSEGKMSEGYGEDSEALEDLAWELQSMTGGRLTHCEGEEGGEGEEGKWGEGEEWGEEGESGDWEEKGIGELEAGMERVRSSFEIYQQELMQQDSD